MADNSKILQNDTLLYRKNKFAANLTLLGLVFSVLYFCLLYGITVPLLSDGSTRTWFVTILIGGSVILTLVTLLVTFLASEGIKAYKKPYVIVLIVLAVIQIARIFIYPIYTLEHSEIARTYFWVRVNNGTTGNIILGVMMIVWLCLSAACLIAAAVVGYINCVKREKHIAAVEKGEINVDKIFKETQAEIVSGDNTAEIKEVK